MKILIIAVLGSAILLTGNAKAEEAGTATKVGGGVAGCALGAAAGLYTANAAMKMVSVRSEAVGFGVYGAGLAVGCAAGVAGVEYLIDAKDSPTEAELKSDVSDTELADSN